MKAGHIQQVFLSGHATQRLEQRFEVKSQWLEKQISHDKYILLPGKGKDPNGEGVRIGMLLYVVKVNRFCVAVLDEKSGAVITTLTEGQAHYSSWGGHLNEMSKRRAKMLAMGRDIDNDCALLKARAEEEGAVEKSVYCQSFNSDWAACRRPLLQINLQAAQIDAAKNRCTLSNQQMLRVERMLQACIARGMLQPYGKLFLKNRQKQLAVSNRITCFGPFDDGLLIRRYFVNM